MSLMYLQTFQIWFNWGQYFDYQPLLLTVILYWTRKRVMCVCCTSSDMFTTLPRWWSYTEVIPVPVLSLIFSYFIFNITVNHSSAPCRCVRSFSDLHLSVSIICSNSSYVFFIKGKEGQTAEWRPWKSDERGKYLFLAARVCLVVGEHQAPCKILQVGK